MSPANQSQHQQPNQSQRQQREDNSGSCRSSASKQPPSESAGPDQKEAGKMDENSSNGDDNTAGVCPVNFMSKFRDKDTRVLKNLNSSQFIEVWNNYDKDGK